VDEETAGEGKVVVAVSEELLRILACPKCRGEVRVTPAGAGLACGSCRLVYPIRDDIPVMLIDEALPLEREES
jgi:uncharacterized protein YbaR (Trm112 family)